MGIYKHFTCPVKIDTEDEEIDKAFIKTAFQNNEAITNTYVTLQQMFGKCDIGWTDYSMRSYGGDVEIVFKIDTPVNCSRTTCPEYQLDLRIGHINNKKDLTYAITFQRNDRYMKLKYGYSNDKTLYITNVTPEQMTEILNSCIKKNWIKDYHNGMKEYEEQQLRLKQDLMKSQLNALEIVPKVNEILQGYGIKPMVQCKIDNDVDDYVTYNVVETEDSVIRLNISPKDVDLEISSYIDKNYSAENIMIAMIETINSANDSKLETSIEIKHINKLYDYINRIGHTLAVANQLKDIWKWGRQKK